MFTRYLCKGAASATGALLFITITAIPCALGAGAGRIELAALHEKIRDYLEHPTPEHPFYLEAEVKKHVERGDAALYIDEPFERIADALEVPANWCDILPLHQNVKGCTYADEPDGTRMTLYLGPKVYKSPEDAYSIDYEFQTHVEPGYFRATMTADEGPLGTSDYRLEFEAMPVDQRTFGRIRISNHQSWLSSKAMHVYLATKGRDKEGISVVGHDDSGNPVYSSGELAAIERNVLRYHLAFSAYLDSRTHPPDQRFEASLERWFNATEKHPQLHELTWEEYLEEKRLERRNQLVLQDVEP